MDGLIILEWMECLHHGGGKGVMVRPEYLEVTDIV
jgi:hypothetical protein